MGGRRALGWAVSRIVVPVVAIVVLSRVLLADTWTASPRAFPRYEPPDGLLPSQEEYVDWDC